MSTDRQSQYDDDDLITEIDEESEAESGNADDFDSEPERTDAEQKPDRKPSRFDKRINQLTYRAKLAEEQAQAALRADEENKRLIAAQAAKLAEFESRFTVADSSAIDSKLADLKKQKWQAVEDMDYDKADALDEEIYELRTKKTAQPERKAEPQQPVHQQQVQQLQKLKPQLDYEAENSDWIMPDGENYDPAKVERANKIAARLFQNGIKPDSPKFWKLVDANLNKQGRGVPSGETGGATGGGKSGGKLTNAEKQTLRNWGGNPDNPADVAEFLKYRKG